MNLRAKHQLTSTCMLPYNDSTSHEKKEEFYGNISSTIDSVTDSYELIVLVDFNGHVGPSRSPWESYLDTLGPADHRGRVTWASWAQ